MARRRSIITSVIREMERSERQRQAQRRRDEAARRKAAREAERRRRQQAAFEEKEQKRIYLESRIEEVASLNEELASRLADLAGVLQHTLQIDDRIDFDSLRITKPFADYNPPEKLTKETPAPLLETYTDKVAKPGMLGKMLGGAKKYEQQLEAARQEHSEASQAYEKEEAKRQSTLKKWTDQYEKNKAAYEAKVRQRDLEVDDLRDSYGQGEEDAVLAYNTMVLERSSYPDDFPQEFSLFYQPESKQLVIEYRLPDMGIIPTVAEYSYVKTKDEIREKARKVTEIRSVYEDLVASIALRTIHEVIEADQADTLEVVVFNGYVETVDPSTGQDIKPYLLSVRTTKEAFEQIILDRVDKVLCLKNLGAQVSPKMNEKTAVKPVVDFNMLDKRFVGHEEVLNALESRPNIFDLNPFEFEQLVTDMFGNLGFEAKLTRSSRDGGVDCIAYDTRPLLGGKVVIQAKRWANVVGVAAVRDLYGTMINEGASKGILVTTSHYGPDAYEFAGNKPIELIDGGGLLFFLEQVGVKARLIPPTT